MGVGGKPLPEEEKLLILDSLVQNGGMIHPTAKACKVSQTTIFKYIDSDDKRFKEAVEAGRKIRMDRMVDSAEKAIAKRLKAEDNIPILFTLKTQGKKRGWSQDIEEIAQQVAVFLNRKPNLD